MEESFPIRLEEFQLPPTRLQPLNQPPTSWKNTLELEKALEKMSGLYAALCASVEPEKEYAEDPSTDITPSLEEEVVQ